MNYAGIYEKLINAHAFLPYYLGGGRALPPLRVQIELTGKCNLKCAFCYQGASYKDAEGELSFEEVIRVIDQVPGQALLTLSGGEPLLKERISEILGHALPRHYCNIITNGVLLSEDICRLLVEKRLTLLNISLDGIERVHDELRGVPNTFKRVRENILYLNEYKLKKKAQFPLVDIKSVIRPENLSQIASLYKFGEEIGAEFLTLSLRKSNNIQFNGTLLYNDLKNNNFYRDYPLNNDLDVRELSDTLEAVHKVKGGPKIRFYPRFQDYKLIEDYLNAESRAFYCAPCLEPWSGLQINAQGKVYPCLAYYAGDILTNSLGEIWNSPALIGFRRRLKDVKIFPACAGCCYLKIRRK